jgi:hypothetical protein
MLRARVSMHQFPLSCSRSTSAWVSMRVPSTSSNSVTSRVCSSVGSHANVLHLHPPPVELPHRYPGHPFGVPAVILHPTRYHNVLGPSPEPPTSCRLAANKSPRQHPMSRLNQGWRRRALWAVGVKMPHLASYSRRMRSTRNSRVVIVSRIKNLVCYRCLVMVAGVV